ncbi:hypothetical protein CANCADRAFT_12718, partial [Tortispora caseinolytica NRRL Y-17796]
REWWSVPLQELTQDDRLVYIDGETSVEEAHNTLLEHGLTSLALKVSPEDDTVSTSFDYANINALLLLVLGKKSIANQSDEAKAYIERAKKGQSVPVAFVASLGPKEPFIKVPVTETLATVVELLGSGVHRIAVTKTTDSQPPKEQVIGILSQRRMLRYLWNNARSFPHLEPLLQATIGELKIGSVDVVSIHEDKPVIEAFALMDETGMSSLAVVDSKKHVLGNISVVDVKYVTNSSQAKLLKEPCKQFLTHVLSGRGVEDGKDSYPVFNVTRNSTLAHAIAKLVATKSHRMWITEPFTSPAIPDIESEPSSLRTTSGKLVGVLSLTDIFALLARTIGKLADPSEGRRQR